MSQASQERRRRLIVDRASQARMVRRLGLTPFALLFAQAVATAVLMRWLLDEVAALQVEIRWAVPFAAMSMAFVMVTATALAVQSLRHSHAVAGPCVRLKKTMQRIRGGEVDFQIKLRKGDELQDVADELNELLRWLQQHRPEGVAAAATAAAPAPADAHDQAPEAQRTIEV